MGKLVTLGGDRLGSGKKMKQAMHNYERSNHNLSYDWRSTAAPGTLIPFMNELLLPGDTFDIDLNAKALTMPTVGPLMGSFKLQLDVFLCPFRLYQAQLHNNKLGVGLDMSKIKLPQFEGEANMINFSFGESPDTQQVNPSSLIAYQGTRGFGCPNNEENGSVMYRRNALKLLSYYDIYKNYYANKQEGKGAIISNSDANIEESIINSLRISANKDMINSHMIPGRINDGDFIEIIGENLILSNLRGFYSDETLQQSIGWRNLSIDCTIVEENVSIITNKVFRYLLQFKSWTINDLGLMQYGVENQYIAETEPRIEFFDLKNIDDMREDILAAIKSPNSFIINKNSKSPYANSFKQAKVGSNLNRCYFSQEGLAIKTYQSDIYNNWLKTETITGANGITEISAVDVSAGLLKMDALNLAQKVYNMLNRIAVSGGSYYDWISAVYSEDVAHTAETPVYLGGLSKEIVFGEVISTAQNEEQPLGTLAGRGFMSDKHKGGKIVVKNQSEPCYVIGIVSITPRLDYSQGNSWDSYLATMDDLHKPALDGIGFQDLITDEIAHWDTTFNDDGTPNFKSAGKIPAWMNYMTKVNQTYGNFAIKDNQMYMTLNRRYEADGQEYQGTIRDLTTYIDPAKYNYAFAQTKRDAQNFWLQIAVNIFARRKISAKQIPNL